MRRDLPLDRIISQTRLYSVDDALQRPGPRRFTLKPEHDLLYQFALDSGLARWFTITLGKYSKRPQPLLERVERTIKRVRWWAANSGTRPAPDVLLLRTDSFDNNWARIREAAESTSRDVAVWHDDPALFTRITTGELVCRAACIGHEGMIDYLAYDHEDEWSARLEESGLRMTAQGRDAYLKIILTPGLVAEGDE